MVNARNSKAAAILPVLIRFGGGSYLNFKIPKRYNTTARPSRIQIAKKISLFKMPQCITRSAFDKNLIMSASSTNANTIFTVFIQLPERGSDESQRGNKANRPNGNPNESPKPP